LSGIAYPYGYRGDGFYDPLGPKSSASTVATSYISLGIIDPNGTTGARTQLDIPASNEWMDSRTLSLEQSLRQNPRSIRLQPIVTNRVLVNYTVPRTA
jgi:hypothetical protein